MNRLPIKKLTLGTSDEGGKRAQHVLEGFLAELPELLMTCVVDVATGKVLAFYTTSAQYNPNQISLRYAKLLRLSTQALTAHPWLGGALADVVMLLDEHLHLLRPLNGGKWYAFLAMRIADANLAIARDVVRRHAN